MNSPCACRAPHAVRRIVLTGGPGAGKTAVLELIRKAFCQHVHVLPEAATILFSGGFPRQPSVPARKAAQRAIFRVQRELEALSDGDGAPAITLCDRGTLDGAAYWPGPAEEMFAELGITRDAERGRYDVVIHLRTPSVEHGYDKSNAVRVESAAVAAAIDARIEAAWAGHPRRFFVASRDSFLDKASEALRLLRGEVPACCRAHPVPELDGGPPGAAATP
jgi:predicted ATPase